MQPCTSKGKHTIIAVLDDVKKIYRSRGFRILFFHGDNEFNINLLKQKMLPSNMKICAKDEHIHIIERSIRTENERSWYTTHSVTNTSLPTIIKNSLVQGWVSWLIIFPPTNGISDTKRLATIILGKPKPYLSKPKMCFGVYELAYTKTNNYMTTGGVPAIAHQ